MKIYITYLGVDYVISFEYNDPVTNCVLSYVDDDFRVLLAVGGTKRHPKDSPNWVIARRIAFENMLEDANIIFQNRVEHIKFTHIAWLHFLDVVKDRI